MWTDNPKYKDKNKGNKKAVVFNDVQIIRNYKPGDDNSMEIWIQDKNLENVEFSGDLFFRIFN